MVERSSHHGAMEFYKTLTNTISCEIDCSKLSFASWWRQFIFIKYGIKYVSCEYYLILRKTKETSELKSTRALWDCFFPPRNPTSFASFSPAAK